MQTVELLQKELDYKQYVKRRANETDYQTLIKDDVLITTDGKPRILYKKLPKEDTALVRQACKNVRYNKEQRTAGLKTESTIFGYNPRNTIRKDFCSVTSMAYNYPKEHNIICGFGGYMSKLYKEHFPNIYNKHKDIVNEKMLKEWVLNDTPFTSGIVNRNNPLKYHFDAGNIQGVLSNMVVFKNGVKGGYLSCPEFDIGFEVGDNTVILFDGQKILHGVTPISKRDDKAYRYSVVYYTLKQIWNCEPIDEEIARARQVRYKREHKRAAGGVNKEDLQWTK